MVKNLLLHGQLDRIGELEAVGAEELDAVVLPGIVRGGDDDSGVEAMGAGEKRNGRCGHDARALHLQRLPGAEPAASVAAIQGPDSRVSRPRRTLGCVDDLAQRVGEGEADAVDRRGVERSLACDGANAVGAEEFACAGCGHDAGFLPLLPVWRAGCARLRALWIRRGS